MARRREQINDDSDSNPGDDMEEEPNFDDPENYEDDITEEGKTCITLSIHMVYFNNIFFPPQKILWEI